MDCSLPGSSVQMGFNRQEYWSGLPFPSPGDLPNPKMERGSPALQADSEPPGESRERLHSARPCGSQESSRPHGLQGGGSVPARGNWELWAGGSALNTPE